MMAKWKELIAKHALRLFKEHGYQGTSVREIAKACDMSLGALYHYIGAKENVLSYLASSHISYMEQLLAVRADSEDTITSLRAAMERWFAYCEDKRDLILVSYRETLHLPQKSRKELLAADERSRRAFEKLLIDGVKRRQMKVADPAVLATNIVVAGHMWALRSWHLGKQYNLREYSERQADLVVAAIRPQSCAKTS